jgi:hypothetical protein
MIIVKFHGCNMVAALIDILFITKGPTLTIV